MANLSLSHSTALKQVSPAFCDTSTYKVERMGDAAQFINAKSGVVFHTLARNPNEDPSEFSKRVEQRLEALNRRAKWVTPRRVF